MSEPVKFGGLLASAFSQRGDKSSGQSGISTFGTLLDDRQGTGDRLAFTTDGKPPRWSWGKTSAPTKSPISQIANNEDNSHFAMEEIGDADESDASDSFWTGTKSAFGSRFASDWDHAQDAGRQGHNEAVPEGFGDETLMVDPSEAGEVASESATALPLASGPISIARSDIAQRPDTDLRTIAGNGGLEAAGRSNQDIAVGDGRRQRGEDVFRPSSMRAEPAEQMRVQAGDATSSRLAEGRVAEVARSNASILSGQQQSDPVAQRVTVLSSQTITPAPPIPAPGQLMPLGTPTSQVVSAIREDGELASRAAAAASQAQQASAARSRPVHTLQIQLHPADLGRVTARMSIEGSQLRVELQVETAKARTQLANDSDAILKALKASGYEIDRMTIQQAPQTANGGSQPGQEKSTANLSAQGGEADEAGEERRRRAGSGNGDQQQGGGHESRLSETARGGLYI